MHRQHPKGLGSKQILALLLFVLPAAGAELEGRYQGRVEGVRKDGTPAQHDVFFIVRRNAGLLGCSGGLNSFDDQLPCENVTFQDDKLRAVIPGWGNVVLELHLIDQQLTGPLRVKSGELADPFQRMEVARIGNLTVSDLVPVISGEGTERSPRLLQLRNDLANGNNGALPLFWQSIERSGAPLIEAAPNSVTSFLVTFLWRGDPQTKSVLVYWRRFVLANPDQYFMVHAPGTDLWFKTLRLRRGTRIYYQLSPNDPLQQRPEGTWERQTQGDPLNPRREPDDPKLSLRQVRSLLELPGAPPQPWYTKRQDVERYTIVDHTISSVYLKAERKLKVYVPPGYSADSSPYGSVYLFDGEDPDGYVFATWTFENLIADGKIPPVVVVRIPNPNQQARQHDLECNDGFVHFLADEAVPFIRKTYNVTTAPERTLIGGYSLGGLAATYAAFRHPEIFGLVLSLSGSYWYEPTHTNYAEPNWLTREFVKATTLRLRFFMNAGVYEVDFTGEGGNILIPNRQLRDVLLAKGYSVQYEEFAGEHDPLNWRGTIADGLIFLLGHGK